MKELKLLHTNEISLLKKYITTQGINFKRLEKEIKEKSIFTLREAYLDYIKKLYRIIYKLLTSIYKNCQQ